MGLGMGKRAGPVDPGAAAGRGQIIVMFALFMTALLGMLGLAIDVGVAYAGRRTAQNAADAAALAGARQVAKWSAATPLLAAQGEAAALADAAGNRLGAAPNTLVSCAYVDYAGAALGPCSLPVPALARGVRAVVREEHPTFFIRVLPGAPASVATEATATAHVQMLTKPPADGPFIVCGDNAWAVKTAAGVSLPGKGINVPLLSGNQINPLYVGWTFRIYDNTLSQGGAGSPSKLAGCDTPASDWNGAAGGMGTANKGKTAPGWFRYEHGSAVGQVNTQVYGIGGCAAGTAKPYNCVMFLPVAKRTPAPSNDDLWVVGFAAFHVTQVDTNSVDGKLLDDFISLGPGSETWCPTCVGIAVVRLTA